MEQNIAELKKILELQDKKLDELLLVQQELHDDVRKRSWVDLERELSRIRGLSDDFVALDERRSSIDGGNRELYLHKEIRDVVKNVRSKLLKSKIENKALSTYVQAGCRFIREVIDECVPQQRNVLYSRKGLVRKSATSSLVVNTVF